VVYNKEGDLYTEPWNLKFVSWA